ncbi:alpha/beta-hydrolase [Sistotremastrum niveocremeum HHB9708]|uniref:Carboxypeptidase n=1 Tax=Sistotremastrum niveocremeum HHB9708 TaxID=1314777 RepID=A0A164TJ44_9AGAM|nr:alpha/beta-hydrolase [Sistotremastrum niveocremeum HHB9708]
MFLPFILLLAILSARAFQFPFPKPAVDPQFETSSGGLATLADEYTTFHHTYFPSYAVRIKRTPPEFCDPTTSTYTGYIDVSPARHLFFYFFESRSDPDTDDVILWTNGGPGGSSSLGLFMELGPCRLINGTTTRVNPYAWNERANLIFIDQPIDHGESVASTEDSAQDIVAFLTIFFENFPKLRGRVLHLAGESYGGRYIPAFAAAIYDSNKKLNLSGLTPINLKSILIGNGFMDIMTPSYYDFMCTPTSVEPFVDIATCVGLKTAMPRCIKWYKESCLDSLDLISCQAAMSFCNDLTGNAMLATGRNPNDVSPSPASVCYPIAKDINEYLNRPEIRKLLGVSPKLDNIPYTQINLTVNAAFKANDRGVRVLLYAGTYDAVCNWIGIQRLAESLEWTNATAFSEQQSKPWILKTDMMKAGTLKSFGGLTFLAIDGAGHMVPYDKPVESLDMLNRWIHEEEF